MKKMLCFTLCGILMQSALATEVKSIPENLSIKVGFNQQSQNHHYSINNHLTMLTNNHQWTIIQNQPSSPSKEPLLLLGKIEDATAEYVTMKFLVIDMKNNPDISSKPMIRVKYGQKGQLTLKSKRDAIEIELSVLPVS